MRLLIFGAGALGSVVGGLLARAGHAVTLVGRAAHLDAIEARGLRISGIWGEHLVRGIALRTDLKSFPQAHPRPSGHAHPQPSPQPHPQTSPQPNPQSSPQPNPQSSPQPNPQSSPQPNPQSSPQAVGGDLIPPGSFDLILICVKSYDTAEAIQTVAPLMDAETLVCSYQNGLGNIETIAARVGWEQSFGARAIYGARVTEPGHVEVTVIAQPTALGVYRHGPARERVVAIAEAMNAAGLPTVYTDSIETVLWSKVAYNCALNPMSALLDVPYGAVGENAETRAIIEDVIHELYAVGAARHVKLEPVTAEAYLAFFFNELLPPTAQHYASMREDFLRRRRTEIQALNGAIWRFGEELGVDTPVNRTLTRMVRAREFQYLSKN